MGMKVNGTSGLTFPDTTTLASAGQASVQAWVNFNGTGTVAIRAAYNVASITDNGTGNYTVNFDTALADANYAATYTSQPATDSIAAAYVTPVALSGVYSTTGVGIRTAGGGAAQDQPIVNVAIFR